MGRLRLNGPCQSVEMACDIEADVHETVRGDVAIGLRQVFDERDWPMR